MDYYESLEFPHYYAFLMRETQKSKQKRIDRELEEQFGKIDEEEEEIWKAEQVKDDFKRNGTIL